MKSEIEYGYEPILFEITVGEDFVGQITWLDEQTGEPIQFALPARMDLMDMHGMMLASFASTNDPNTQPYILASPTYGLFQMVAQKNVTVGWQQGTYHTDLWASMQIDNATGALPFNTQLTKVCSGLVKVYNRVTVT